MLIFLYFLHHFQYLYLLASLQCSYCRICLLELIISFILMVTFSKFLSISCLVASLQRSHSSLMRDLSAEKNIDRFDVRVTFGTVPGAPGYKEPRTGTCRSRGTSPYQMWMQLSTPKTSPRTKATGTASSVVRRR